MVPSGLTISASTPAGYRPANRARSTAASVWPGRSSTPPARHSRGKTWPGRLKSSTPWLGSITTTNAPAAKAAMASSTVLIAGSDQRRDDVLAPQPDRLHHVLVRHAGQLHAAHQLVEPGVEVLLRRLGAVVWVADDDHVVV